MFTAQVAEGIGGGAAACLPRPHSRDLLNSPVRAFALFGFGVLVGWNACARHVGRGVAELEPIAEALVAVEGGGESHPGVPQLVHGRLLVPFRNAGTVAAVEIVVTVTIAEQPRSVVVDSIVEPGGAAATALIGAPLTELPSFEVELRARAAAGRRRTSRFLWDEPGQASWWPTLWSGRPWVGVPSLISRTRCNGLR